MKKFSFIIAACLFSMAIFHNDAAAQTDKPYTDGSVWNISFVKTKSGMYDTYVKDLSANWVKLFNAAKSKGYILDYKVISSPPASAHDWDLMLMVAVKNFAALDDLDDKLDKLGIELIGTEDKQHQSALSRNNMRELMGGKLGREVIFK